MRYIVITHRTIEEHFEIESDNPNLKESDIWIEDDPFMTIEGSAFVEKFYLKETNE